MTAPDDLLQTWSHDLAELLPGVRITQIRGWVKLAVGIILAESCAITRTARVLPGRAASNEKQSYRWIANYRLDASACWREVRRGLLSAWAGREVTLVFDPTVHGGVDALQVLSVVQGSRAAPVAWRIASQVERWETAQAEVLAEVLAETAADLPATAGPVTVLLDRGLQGAAMVDAVRRRGWQVVLRMQAGEQATARARVDLPGAEVVLANWVRTVVRREGEQWTGRVSLFKKAGWRSGWLTVWWEPGQPERLVLFSTREGGAERVTEYARRMRVEAAYADLKSRGLRLEQSRVRSRERQGRVLLAVMLAYWMLLAYGDHVEYTGWRWLVDRPDRATMARWRIGKEWVLRMVRAGMPPALPLMAGPEGPCWRWGIWP